MDDDGNIPVSNRLAQNYPNPFLNGVSTNAAGNPTIIEYTLTQSGQAEIGVYNLQGQLVRTLINQNQIAGKYFTTWDGRDSNGQALPSGTYLYRLKIGAQFFETKRLILVK